MTTNLQRKVRIRMFETKEKYTTALLCIQSHPEESDRLDKLLRTAALRKQYPFTPKDGLNRRHLLSAFESNLRAH